MQYNTLIQNIQADIYSNGYELITGDILQSVLLQMVGAWAGAGAMYGGVITPASAAPADLDQATVYLALPAGTYTNFVDSNNDPIVTTGPAIITYDGGASLVFDKTDLPSGGSGATIITNDGSEGDSVAIKLTDNQSYQRSFRIDMTAEHSGYSNEQRIGSLLIECRYDADIIAHGYYYGDTLADILSEVAVYQDDTDPDTFYLMLTHDSSLDSVTFAISPTDGGEVDAIITNAADDHTKVDDANITEIEKTANKVSTISGNETSTSKYPNTKAVADALGKMGVISQTQTWSGSGSGRTYTMSNLVTGLIPQANIDMFVRAGATFNQSTGYFEMNGLTDLSYNEMMDSMRFGNMPYNLESWLYGIDKIRTNFPPIRVYENTITTAFRQSEIEAVAFYPTGTRLINNGANYAFYSARNLKRIIGILDITNSTSGARFIQYANLLESFQIKGLKFSVEFSTPYMDKASLLYLINNEASTSAITITLEASVYAKCQSGGEWYSDISTALAAHTNVSLASA